MKQIRANAFETNSSSTHSISICREKRKNNIPQNSKILVDGTLTSERSVTPLDKLCFVVNMLTKYTDEEYYNAIDNGKTMKKLSFEEMIQQDVFKWLREIIKEDFNTELEYRIRSNYFPWMDYNFDDCQSISQILGSFCDLKDEQSFKENIRELIINDEYVMEYGEERF